MHFLGGDSVGMQENIRTSSSDAGFKMKRQDLPDKIILSYANGTQLLMKKVFFPVNVYSRKMIIHLSLPVGHHNKSRH